MRRKVSNYLSLMVWGWVSSNPVTAASVGWWCFLLLTHLPALHLVALFPISILFLAILFFFCCCETTLPPVSWTCCCWGCCCWWLNHGKTFNQPQWERQWFSPSNTLWCNDLLGVGWWLVGQCWEILAFHGWKSSSMYSTRSLLYYQGIKKIIQTLG